MIVNLNPFGSPLVALKLRKEGSFKMGKSQDFESSQGNCHFCSVK